MYGYLSVDMICSKELKGFPGEENFELRKTKNVSKYLNIFMSNGSYHVYYYNYNYSSIFCNMCSFQNWKISLGYSQFKLGKFLALFDVFRPVILELILLGLCPGGEEGGRRGALS